MSLSDAAALVKVRHVHVAWEQQADPCNRTALHYIASSIRSQLPCKSGMHLPSILSGAFQHQAYRHIVALRPTRDKQ